MNEVQGAVCIPPGHTVVLQVSSYFSEAEMYRVAERWNYITGKSPIVIDDQMTVHALMDSRRYANRRAAR